LYSIAGDGRVTNWTIVKTALWYTDTLSITFSQILQNLSKEDTKDNLKGLLVLLIKGIALFSSFSLPNNMT
jgi:hypothetical protein